MMMGFLNNIMFWIISFFVSAVLLIMLVIMLILIKMKTHAIVELKAFIRKRPVSIFFEDGKFLDMRADPVEAGTIRDKDYGMFVRNDKNTYLGKSTRNIYDVYDTGFAPGINVKAAQTAEVLETVKNLLSGSDAIENLQQAIVSDEIKDESIDCLRSNINISFLKRYQNCIEPHNINASVEKKVAKQVNAMNNKGNAQIILIFLAVFGALIGGYILLKMFNV